MQTFAAEIVATDRGGAYVCVPPPVVTALGGKGRIPVLATFDGIAYRGSIVSMGGPDKVIGILKSIRGELGKVPGDVVTVTLAVDESHRTLEIPDDLGQALDAAGLRQAFVELAFTHQREYVTWIDEAKKPETRARRISATVDKLGA